MEKKTRKKRFPKEQRVLEFKMILLISDQISLLKQFYEQNLGKKEGHQMVDLMEDSVNDLRLCRFKFNKLLKSS